MVAARFLALESRPTAMCIVNDHAASAFVNEVQRGGLRVPHDLSVVSHDSCLSRATALCHSQVFLIQSKLWRDMPST